MLLIVVMFTKRTTVATFVIVMALVLITASSYASSASAEKLGHKGKKSSIDNGSTPTSSTISKKDLKSLSNCESKAAKNGGLTQAQVDDCYNQLFPQDQTLKSTPMQGQPTSALEHQTGFPFK
jgi:predicted lipoprotein with Yx(FWY)xxD motif